jgi:hypothetical protein
VGTGGTSRIDNFTVTGINPGLPTVTPVSQSTNIFLGDAVSFAVTGGGSTPLSYQWYYPNLSTPLADGSTTYGAISGSSSSSLALSFVSTNQAGTYYVILTNSLGSATGQVSLAVGTRTPIVTNIAYLRTLLLPVTYAPKDTTNLYTVLGIVTSHVNTTGSTNAQFYIQDGSAGLLVFISGGSASLPNAGDRVQVTGPLNQFYGQLELNTSALNPSHGFTNISSGNPLPTPVVFNFANQTNIAYMKAIESSLVVASGVYFGSSNAYFVSGSTVNLTNLNNVAFPLYINAYVEDIIASATPPFGSVTALMTQHASGTVYTNGFELVATQDADIIGSIPPVGFQAIPGNIVITWPGGSSYILQSATNVAGPFQDIPSATSPYTNDETTLPVLFFRLEQPPEGS